MNLIRKKIESSILIRFITILIIALTININLQASQILLKKNNIVITNDDLKKYKKLHNDFYGNEILDNTAIKKLYITFKIVDFQTSINPDFLKQTNKIISKDIEEYKKIYSEYIMSYFLRFEILKNDFISLHIKNNYLDDLNDQLIEDIALYQDNKCEIPIGIIKFKELDEKGKKKLLSNLSNKVIFIKKNVYICLDDKSKKEINNLVNDIFSKKAYQEFLKYVYKTIK